MFHKTLSLYPAFHFSRMTTEIILVFSILLLTIILFAFEVFSVDKISFFLIAILAVTGLVSPEEAISGFSNPATITVLCLLIIAIAMEDNGVISSLAKSLNKLGLLPLFLLIPILMLITGTISAFINTTAVVVVFIKIISELSKRFKLSESKLLMPISFAGILGGSCTLMGTSTNLIVSSVAADHGAESFSFFEFTYFGVIFLGIGIVIVTLASRWLPKTENESIEDSYELDKLITTIRIGKDSELVGKKINDTLFYQNPDVFILKLIRNHKTINSPGRYITLREDDKMLVMCDVESLQTFSENENLFLIEEQEGDKQKMKEQLEAHEKKSPKGKEELPNEIRLIELLILPGSLLIGRTLKQLRSTFGMGMPVAIKKRKNIRNTTERLLRKNIKNIQLKSGDRLLIEIERVNMHRLHELENIAILRDHEITASQSPIKRRLSTVILLLVVGLAASGVLNILVSAIVGVALLLLTRCLDLNDVYKKVNWEVIFLLAGMIPLGVALSNTGADQFISDLLSHFLSNHSVMFSIGSVFLITMLLSSFISNNATAVIMTPIAIAVATGLDLSMKPFILTVLFGANFSFFTPIGYQTNTLIYGMGYYKFKHFLIIGGILSIVLWLSGTFLLSQMV